MRTFQEKEKYINSKFWHFRKWQDRTEEEKIDKGDYTLYYSGKYKKKILEIKPLSETISYGQPAANISVINAYAYTEEATIEGKIEFYKQLEEINRTYQKMIL